MGCAGSKAASAVAEPDPKQDGEEKKEDAESEKGTDEASPVGENKAGDANKADEASAASTPSKPQRPPLGQLKPGARRTSLQTREAPALPLSANSALRNKDQGAARAKGAGGGPVSPKGGAAWQTLHQCAEAGDLPGVKAAVDGQKVYLDEKTNDKNRCTALWLAAQAGRVPVVQYLVDEGSALELPNSLGQTPLYAACAVGRTEMVKLLISLGAAVDKPARDGTTPLFAAVANGHVEAAQVALENAPRLDVRARDGRTLLSAAVQCGRDAMMDALLVFKADLDLEARDDEGRTALYLSAAAGSAGCARKLLNKGAAPGAAAADGTTPLWSAAYGGFDRIVAMLMEKGATAALATACTLGPAGIVFREGVGEDAREAVRAVLTSDSLRLKQRCSGDEAEEAEVAEGVAVAAQPQEGNEDGSDEEGT